MTRAEATELLTRVLERVVASVGDRRLPALTGVWVFGSYARGALDPGDVDLVVEYETDDVQRDMAMSFRPGPIRSLGAALLDDLDSEDRVVISWSRYGPEALGADLRLLWKPGDGLEEALDRVSSIAPDPDAQSHKRDV